MVSGGIGCLSVLQADGITSAAGGPNSRGSPSHSRISATSLVLGIMLVVVMGIAGGVLPALRAARMPITAAYRAIIFKPGMSLKSLGFEVRSLRLC